MTLPGRRDAVRVRGVLLLLLIHRRSVGGFGALGQCAIVLWVISRCIGPKSPKSYFSKPNPNFHDHTLVSDSLLGSARSGTEVHHFFSLTTVGKGIFASPRPSQRASAATIADIIFTKLNVA